MDAPSKFPLLWIIIIVIMFSIFSVDLQVPTDMGAAIPYLGVVMLALWLPKSRDITLVAILCSLLTIGGYHLSTSFAGKPLNGFTNRLLILFAIWITASIAMYRKKADLRNHHNELRQKAILEASLDPIITLNNKGIIESASHAVETVFGWKPHEVKGKTIELLLDEPYASEYHDYIQNPTGFSSARILGEKQEVQGKKKDLSTFPCELSVAEVKSPELEEHLFMCIVHDITDRKKAQDKLVWLSQHDELTQIYNRRYFNEQILQEWRRLMREEAPMALILLDVDHFKDYNDTLGHQAGDECLRMIAHLFPQQMQRPSDFVARYGGEEFAILLPNTTVKGAVTIADRIQKEMFHLAIPHPISKVGGVVTLSMGIACMTPTRTCSYEVLIRMADFSLYQAKENGRNCYVIYDSQNSTSNTFIS